MGRATKRELIEIPREAAERLRDEARRAALTTIRDILTAYDDGEITRQERDELMDAVLDRVSAGLIGLLDVVIALPSPAEELSDMAIEQGVEAARPLLAPALAELAGLVERVREALDRDPERLERRIREALREGQIRKARRLTKLYVRHFREQALEFGKGLLEGDLATAKELGYRRAAGGGVLWSER